MGKKRPPPGMEGMRQAKKQRKALAEPDYGNGQSYRPSNEDNKPKKRIEDDNRHASRDAPRQSGQHSHPQQDPPQRVPSNTEVQVKQPNNHSKSYREKNLSSRIASLQKQLDHTSSTMPAHMLDEKQRELAFLKSNQKEEQDKVARNKIISRYHRIRFFERRKAVRALVRIRKAFQRAIENADQSEEEHSDPRDKPTRDNERRAKIDLAYTMFAPLEEKYISIFKADLSENWRGKSRKRKNTEAQRTEDDGLIIRLNESGEDGFRPTHWHAIARVMYPSEQSTESAEGTDTHMTKEDDDKKVVLHYDGRDANSTVEVTPAQMRALEAIRDHRPSRISSNGDADALPIRAGNASSSKKASSTASKSAADWQAETDGAINPEDADSDSEDDEYDAQAFRKGKAARDQRQQQGKKQHAKKGTAQNVQKGVKAEVPDDGSDDEDDFFER